MSLRGYSQCAVVRGHHRICLHSFAPQEGSGEVDCIEGAQCSWQRLSGPVQHGRVDLYNFERSEQLQNRAPPRSKFRVWEVRANPQSVQSSQALRSDQRARHAMLNLARLGQSVRLPKRKSEQYGSIYVGDHR
jgi:hypothetical protein